MMSLVKAVIRPLKAKATTRPTATTITSPRMRKFLKPFMPFAFPSGEVALWGMGRICGGVTGYAVRFR